MSMSKQDYEVIAERIAVCSDMEEMVTQLAQAFAEGNSHFDKKMFFEATGRDIVEDYEVNCYGRITSPGKFENEMYWMPLAYQAHLEGDSRGFDGALDGVWQVFIEWGHVEMKVFFFEDNVGFVHEVQEADVLATLEGHADD